MAKTVQKNAGLGHAWQKMVCLFTDRRGIDAKPRSRWIPELFISHRKKITKRWLNKLIQTLPSRKLQWFGHTTRRPGSLSLKWISLLHVDKRCSLLPLQYDSWIKILFSGMPGGVPNTLVPPPPVPPPIPPPGMMPPFMPPFMPPPPGMMPPPGEVTNCSTFLSAFSFYICQSN